MTRIERLITACAVAATAATAACGSSTSIEQTWKPSSSPPAAMRQVVVVMLSNDVSTRHIAEDRMAAQLRHAGVAAMQGYRVLTDEDFANRAAAKVRLVDAGYDGLIVMRLVGADQQLQFVPTYWDYGPGWYGTGWWGPGWGGYYQTETIVRVETSAYSLRDGRLEYTALSRTIDPSSVKYLIDSVTSKVAHALTKQRVVIATSTQPAAG